MNDGPLILAAMALLVVVAAAVGWNEAGRPVPRWVRRFHAGAGWPVPIRTDKSRRMAKRHGRRVVLVEGGPDSSP